VDKVSSQSHHCSKCGALVWGVARNSIISFKLLSIAGRKGVGKRFGERFVIDLDQK
jgi:hypothetical protein